jgi:ubiquinone/menaquinone biosynthesis C-methylase UbiE
MLQNKDVYSAPDVAAGYGRQTHLQPPEETILRLMMPFLSGARMLDVGVGGGRTALHFAKWVREYVGTDYSESMIRECERRFAGYPAHISFRVCDARSMEMFEDGSFDFILFSHNGIDSVSHEDRLKILGEIRRVGKPGSHFCFSSHNLNWCANFFEMSRMISLDPRRAVRTAKRLVYRFYYNRSVSAAAVRNSPYIMFNEGSQSRKLLTYFVRPREQLAQLQGHFTNVRIFSQATGEEIKDLSRLGDAEDPWLYYLCNLK